ncbi:hypothetical protein D9M72_438950 [compost metagenome]
MRHLHRAFDAGHAHLAALQVPHLEAGGALRAAAARARGHDEGRACALLHRLQVDGDFAREQVDARGFSMDRRFAAHAGLRVQRHADVVGETERSLLARGGAFVCAPCARRGPEAERRIGHHRHAGDRGRLRQRCGRARRCAVAFRCTGCAAAGRGQPRPEPPCAGHRSRAKPQAGTAGAADRSRAPPLAAARLDPPPGTTRCGFPSRVACEGRACFGHCAGPGHFFADAVTKAHPSWT